jgi:hypothetical protein
MRISDRLSRGDRRVVFGATACFVAWLIVWLVVSRGTEDAVYAAVLVSIPSFGLSFYVVCRGRILGLVFCYVGAALTIATLLQQSHAATQAACLRSSGMCGLGVALLPPFVETVVFAVLIVVDVITWPSNASDPAVIETTDPWCGWRVPTTPAFETLGRPDSAVPEPRT